MNSVDFKLNKKNIVILLLVTIITSVVSIQVYKVYVSEPKIEIVNIFWSKYSKVYESALNATLTTYCNDGATIMIQEHINEETSKLFKELNSSKN